MSAPATAREALIAEAIGDLAELLERLEEVPPELDASRDALLAAGINLARQIPLLEKQQVATSQELQIRAIRYIGDQAKLLAEAAFKTEMQNMEKAALALFRTQLDPTLARLASPLQRLVTRLEHPGHAILTHVAALLTGASLTWALVVWWVSV